MADETIVLKASGRPAKGAPVLHWEGKRPCVTVGDCPVQVKERYGREKDGWIDKLFWGDNLQVLGHLLSSFRGKVDLIYIDPPFGSGATYKKKISLKGKSPRRGALEESQYGDVRTDGEYLQFIYERAILCRELLAPTGVFVLHCDGHRSAYLNVLLDEVFGRERMINEVIWRYETGGIPEKNFSRKHDTLLIYGRGDGHYFDRAAASVPRDICLSCGSRLKKWNNLKREVDADGRVYRTIRSNGKVYAYYDDEPVLLSDVWTDISHIQQRDPQRLNYPTQKPEKLLERIIRVFSPPGGLVLDCFMGSGTAPAVAKKLGRRFLGADINLGAVRTATKRLLAAAKEGEAGFEVCTVNNYDLFRNPLEARELILRALGVRPAAAGSVFDGEADGRMYKLMSVGRIAAAADVPPLVSRFPFDVFDRRRAEDPQACVLRLTVVCTGHEPGLEAAFAEALRGYRTEVEVLDLSERGDLKFKRETEAEIAAEGGCVVIRDFRPHDLMQKLSAQGEAAEDWRQLAESVMIDFDYDGKVLRPAITDFPERGLVAGVYPIPEGAGRIRVKITDLLSESFETDVG